MYFWWCFISIGPRDAPAAFMKCFQVHEGLLKKCWLRSSISITMYYCSYQSLHDLTLKKMYNLIFVYIWCSFCSIIVKRRNSYAYESPAQRRHFSYSSMPGEYVEGRPVLGLGFWAHFPVGWAWDLRQVALKQIGWNMTDGRNINNHEGIVWKWRDLNEDRWKPRVCPLWLLWVGPVEMDVETPELKVSWKVYTLRGEGWCL